MNVLQLPNKTNQMGIQAREQGIIIRNRSATKHDYLEKENNA